MSNTTKKLLKGKLYFCILEQTQKIHQCRVLEYVSDYQLYRVEIRPDERMTLPIKILAEFEIYESLEEAREQIKVVTVFP